MFCKIKDKFNIYEIKTKKNVYYTVVFNKSDTISSRLNQNNGKLYTLLAFILLKKGCIKSV